MNKKINYSDPVPREALDEILNRAFAAADNLEQHKNMDPKQYKLNLALLEKLKNKTNMTNETTNRTDEIKDMNNIIQTNTDATDNIPTWKKLYKSFVAMLIVFMFVYTGFNVLTWLYDTLGMDNVMPTLIGIMIWILVYDHMYGTASKAPRVK